MSASHEASTDGSDSASEGEVDDEDVSILTTPGTSQTPIQRHFIPLPGAKSKVWKYFAFEADGNNVIQNHTVVFCQVPNCDSKVGYSKNTTNMSKHLQRHHPTEYTEIQNSADSSGDRSQSGQPHNSKDSSKPTHFQTVITDTYHSVEPYRKNNPRYKACEEALANFLCLDLQPLSIVNSPSFLQLLKTLDPKFTPSSVSQFTRVVIPNLYEKTKSKVKDNLGKVEYLSVTTDAWSGCHNRSYISVTAHFIDSSWNLKHYCLQIQEITESHTAVNLADDLKNSLEQWEILDRVVMITTDNAANITNAVVNELELPHFGCVGHVLQLSIGKAFKLSQVDRVLGKVKKLVAHFQRSNNETYALREKQDVLHLPKHELIQECITRWSSCYKMLERVLEQQQALYGVLMEKKEKHVRALLPDAGEWGIIEDLISVLEPFADATKALSGSKYSTISLLAPILYKLINKTLKENNTDSIVLKSTKQAIRTDLKSRYESLEVQRLLHVAAFLDPRFKKLDPFVAEGDREDVVEDVIAEVLRICEQDDHGTVQLPQLEDSEESEDTGPATKKRKGVLSKLLGDVITTKTSKKHTTLDTIKSEIQCYQHDTVAELNDDPLKWWSTRELQYVNLAKMVKKYLCMPSTSVRSEEVFSTAGNVLTHKRNRLLPENVNRLVFLHENLMD